MHNFDLMLLNYPSQLSRSQGFFLEGVRAAPPTLKGEALRTGLPLQLSFEIIFRTSVPVDSCILLTAALKGYKIRS